MAGRERHVVEFGKVPRGHDVPARVWIRFQVLDQLGDLVDVAAVQGEPAAPLHAVAGPRALRLFQGMPPAGHMPPAGPLFEGQRKNPQKD